MGIPHTPGGGAMKRWLLWNLRCLRGRRCARIVIGLEAPEGIHIAVEFTCGGCGTRYFSKSDGEVIRLS
jgi:hypothetical protein